MGKHSSTRQWPFYRSLIAWVLPWVLLATVIVGASWATVRAIGGDELETPPPQRSAAMTTVAPTPSPSSTPEDEPSPEPTKTRREKKEKPAEEEPARAELITDGITLQVLNATPVTGAARKMRDRLVGLGFRVISVESAAVYYDHTTVFWSYPEARPAARALASRMGWRSSLKPNNLSSKVDVHVIVGRDEV